jgi:RNA polymerase sigma factor (TIGR02999 family)
LGTRVESADTAANRERLFTLVYDELHRIAGRVMRGGAESVAITPTGLVHELYLKLVDQTRVDWTDRARFLAVAARAMRHILADQVRARDRQKRGGGALRVAVSEDLVGTDDRDLEAVHLSDLFENLARTEERASAVAEMRIFGGLTHEEIAHALGISKRTVDSDWKRARRWLRRELARSR